MPVLGAGVTSTGGTWVARNQAVPKPSGRLGRRLRSQHQRPGRLPAHDFHWQMCRSARTRSLSPTYSSTLSVSAGWVIRDTGLYGDYGGSEPPALCLQELTLVLTGQAQRAGRWPHTVLVTAASRPLRPRGGPEQRPRVPLPSRLMWGPRGSPRPQAQQQGWALPLTGAPTSRMVLSGPRGPFRWVCLEAEWVACHFSD